MRLRKRKIQKQALALALAASVAVAVPATAHAAEDGAEQDVIHEGGTESEVFAGIPEEEIFVCATWDAGAGEVEVYTDDNGHVISKQGDKTYDHTANNDNELNILNHEDYNNKDVNKDYGTKKNASGDTGSDAEAAKPKTDGIIDIQNKTDGTAEKINVNIKGVTTDISGGGKADSSAVAIGDEVKNFDVNIEGTKIHSNASDAAVDIGNDVSNVEVNVKNTEINVNGEGGAAINIGERSEAKVKIKDIDITLNGVNSSGVKTEKDSKVTLTVNGSNTIKAGKATAGGYYNILDELNSKRGKSTTTMEGISVGGGACDSYGKRNNAKMTVTSEEEGASLKIDGMGTGIMVREGAELTIDGDGKKDNIKDTLEIDISNTLNTYSTTAGRGILSGGELTITDGAKVNITDTRMSAHGNHADPNTVGVCIHGGGDTITISNEASVNIANVEGYGVLVESYENNNPGKLNIDNATLNINGTARNAIELSSSDATISGGAKVNIGNKEQSHYVTKDGKKYSSGFNGINMGTTTQADGTDTKGVNKLIITGKGTTVTVLDVYKTGMQGSCAKDVSITDGASVNIKNAGSYGATFYGENMLIDNAILDMNDGDFLLWGPYSKKELDELGYGVPTLTITNGAKVSVKRLYNYSDGPVNLYVTGGTLSLSSKGNNGLTGKYYKTLYNESFAKENSYLVWPTNSPINGDERLVNFKLSAEQLKKLLDRLPDEHKGTYTIDGDTLSFITYGYDAETKELKQYSYVVDLSKYADGETLDVWVPAVILDYYYLDNSELPTEDEKTAKNAGGSLNGKDQYIGGSGKTYDAIIRGQSIAFATLSGDYTTGNTSESDKLWYYWDGTAWKAFTDTTPIKAYSLGDEATKEGAKPIIGVKKPEPTPDPKPEPKPDPKPRPDDPDDPVTPVVPVVPDVPVEPVTPVTPAAPETPAEAVPTAETAVTPATAPADNSPRLPQTGAAWMQAFGLAAAGLMLSLGSLFKKGRHEGE